MKTAVDIILELRDFIEKGDVKQKYVITFEDADTLVHWYNDVSTKVAILGAISAGQIYADIAKDARHEVPVGETANNG